MTTAPALRPCPFCGGPARVIGNETQFVMCDDCEIIGPKGKDAIAAWNARPGGDEAVREALVELVAAADYKAVLVVVGADMHDRHEAVDDFWRAIDKAKAALRTHGASSLRARAQMERGK